MCSVVETEPLENKKTKKKRNKDEVKNETKTEGACMKCSEIAMVLVRNGDPLCKTCFLDYITRKFRATIGKARVIHQGERVLLAVSGGSASAAMLDLVVRGLKKEVAKKLRFQPGVVYIDEGELFGRSVEERQVVSDSIKTVASNVGFPFHFATLEEIFSRKTCESIKDLPTNSSIIELFNDVETITAKDDLLLHLYRWLLLKVAKDHGYDRVMVGDCSTTLSVRILADVAQGRGSQLPFNIGFQDNRSEVSILRPMREFSKKEIEYYNNFNQVKSFSLRSFATKAPAHASVNRLTQEFIFGLQAAFPSTVSTVLRTGDKITSSDISMLSHSCSLCGAPFDGNGGLDNTMIYSGADTGSGDSVEGGVDGSNGGCAGDSGDIDHAGIDGGKCSGSSRSHGDDGGSADDNGGFAGSNSGDNGGSHRDHVDIESCSKDGAGCSNTIKQPCCTSKSKNNATSESHQLAIHNLPSTLCYGCKLTHKDFNTSKIILPEFVAENAIKTLRRAAMKEEIKDYLIDIS